MKTLTVFDPAMCCSTGVCGSDVDQVLVDFSADVQWLKGRGVQVERYNAQQPMSFVQNESESIPRSIWCRRASVTAVGR